MNFAHRSGVALLGLSTLQIAINLALAAPPDAGQLLNEQQRQAQPPVRPADRPQLLDKEPLSAADEAGFRATINQFRFSGADGLISETELQAVVADAKGRALTHAQMQVLAQRVSAAVQARGYLLARAYLPRQDLSEGVLEIAILAGRLEQGPGRVRIVTGNQPLGERLSVIAGASLPEGPVRNDQLERALLLINDVPGVQARATLEKGAELGSSRLIVRADTGPAWVAGAAVDNFSNRYTGEWRTSAQASLNRPLNREDLLGASVSHSSGSDLLGVNYSLGLNGSGLRANFAASWMRYDVGAELAPLDLTGSARTLNAGLSFPLIRARDRNLWASVDGEHKQLTDKALGQTLRERRMNKVTAMLSANGWDDLLGGGFNEASLGAAAGDLSLGQPTDALSDSLSARTQGGFSKAVWRLARSQTLPGLPGWGLYAGASGQFAGNNLDSSEKFLLGGPSGVRGHAVGEASGDSGWLVNVEVRRDLRIGDLRGQVLGFVDHGRVRQHIQPWAGSVSPQAGNEYGLSGAGVGVNLYGDRWSLRSAYAHRLGGNPGASIAGLNADGRSSRQHLWVQASLRF